MNNDAASTRLASTKVMDRLSASGAHPYVALHFTPHPVTYDPKRPVAADKDLFENQDN